MNLDVFWSRARKTVRDNAQKVRAMIDLSKSVGMLGPFDHEGPYPPFDHCGYEVASNILLYSKRKGKHDSSYTQFETIRKLRSTFGNQLRSSPGANTNHLCMSDAKGKYSKVTNDKCGSLRFQRFMDGCQVRMGVVWKPNTALSVSLLLDVIKEAESHLEHATEIEEEHHWVSFITYVTVSYVLSLRGDEGFLLDLEGLNANWSRNDGTYFRGAVLGKIKGERTRRSHLIPCSNVTSSGIKIKEIVSRSVQMKSACSFSRGPAISDKDGQLMSSANMDKMLCIILFKLFELNPDRFPPHIKTPNDIEERYYSYRTWRRTSDTRALEQGVDGKDIDVVNRWSNAEKSKKGKVNQPMKQHYAQIELLIKPFKRYTWAM